MEYHSQRKQWSLIPPTDAELKKTASNWELVNDGASQVRNTLIIKQSQLQE